MEKDYLDICNQLESLAKRVEEQFGEYNFFISHLIGLYYQLSEYDELFPLVCERIELELNNLKRKYRKVEVEEVRKVVKLERIV